MSKINMPKFLAHRGASGYFPENTLLAMRKAAELGAKWVEFDVMLTADELPIIIHDETLDRTTNATGEVAQFKWDVIAGLDAGSWFNPQFNTEKIPTLIQLLDLLNSFHLQMNIEIKPSLGKDEITAIKTIETLKNYYTATQPLPLISSASMVALKTVYQLNPMLPLGLITDVWLENWEKQLSALHCVSLHINHKELTPMRVANLKQAGKYLLAYTVNDLERAKELFDWGVDGIFTDFIDKMQVLVQK